jgi:hypothetical protein
VLDHNGGLEQHDECLDAGLVVKAIFQVVQHWFYKCPGFLQTPELSQTHGTRGRPDYKPVRAAASRSQACLRGLFLGRGEPDIRAPEVQRWGNQLRKAKGTPAHPHPQLIGEVPKSLEQNQRLLQASVDDGKDHVMDSHQQTQVRHARALCQFRHLPPQLLSLGPLSLRQLNGTAELQRLTLSQGAHPLTRPASTLFGQPQPLVPVLRRTNFQKVDRATEHRLDIALLAGECKRFQSQACACAD